jgi:hypothetical protein
VIQVAVGEDDAIHVSRDEIEARQSLFARKLGMHAAIDDEAKPSKFSEHAISSNFAARI